METQFSYDRLPYSSKFFVQTHPARLATHASLFGMTPAPAETCRVLELGCGNGSNLLAQASLAHGSAFVGVDLSQVHIDDAIAAAAKLGITNCEFRQMDVMDMSAAEFGTFDYITAHGLISWVPEPVRAKVFELFRELLSENGVGYISYSAYPGAHQREMVQRAMQFHAGDVSDPYEKVGKAMGFLKFLTENTPDRGIYHAALTHELARHARHDTSDIFHDDLSEFSKAFYFHEFAGLLDTAGLQYLAEADLLAMGTNDLSQEARTFVDSLDNFVEREQYLDLLRGRIFRQTLFCHREVQLERRTGPSIMDRFMIASSLRPEAEMPDLASVKIEKFIGAENAGIEIDQPLVKTMLSIAGRMWPRAVSYSELVGRGQQTLTEAGYAAEDWAQQEDFARRVFFSIAQASSLVTLHTWQPEAFTDVSDRPRISDLARWQIGRGDHILTGFGLDMKVEDSISKRLLELLDGTRDKPAVLEAMTEFIRTAEDIEGRKELIRNLPEWLSESITNLARMGVFAA